MLYCPSGRGGLGGHQAPSVPWTCSRMEGLPGASPALLRLMAVGWVRAGRDLPPPVLPRSGEVRHNCSALPRSLLTATFHDPMWMCVGESSPNHNTANQALEPAGQGVIHGLRAVKHGGKPSEVAPPIYVWPRSVLKSGPLTLLLALSGPSCKSRALYTPPGPQ